MRLIEIESWARSIIERVIKQQPIEDGRVELKTDWTESNKVARQIAGHANSARGEDLLWLIGVNEKKGTIPGANPNELSTWWAQVQSEFESECPGLQNVNFEEQGKIVVALHFNSGRFPFVTKNPKGGEVQFEVPWREGNSTRSARRQDLVRLLGPLIKMPKLELLDGHLQLVSSTPPTFKFDLTTYVTPIGSDTLCFRTIK